MTRKIHDSVAHTYNSEGGIIGAKNRAALDMLAQRFGHRRVSLRVADLGVGDGALLERLAGLPLDLQATGLDVSPAMLRIAGQRVAIDPVIGSAEHAADLLPNGTFDLVLAHFILAYVGRRALFGQVRRLLAPGGVVSLVTSTEEGGAPFYAALDRHFLGSRNPLRWLIGRAAQRGLAASSVPKDWPELQADLEAAGLEVLERQTLRIAASFETPEDAYRYGIDEGWAANFLAMPGVPLGLAQWLCRRGLAMCDYPFRFVQVVEIVEAGRRACNDAGEAARDAPSAGARG